MRRRRCSTQELRLTIDCLPLRTRIAMLEGVRSNDIIVGAYADRRGRRLPDAGRPPLRRPHELHLLRQGVGRLRRRQARPAGVRARAARAAEPSSRRASWPRSSSTSARRSPTTRACAADGDGDGVARAGDPDRSAELRTREGWSWLRPFRRLDEYERALARVEEQAPPDRERAPV